MTTSNKVVIEVQTVFEHLTETHRGECIAFGGGRTSYFNILKNVLRALLAGPNASITFTKYFYKIRFANKLPAMVWDPPMFIEA